MHRDHVRVRVSLGVVCMALAFALAPAAVAATHGGRPAKHRRIPLKDRPIEVAVSTEGSEAGAPVPQDFLGLSFEVGSLAQIGAYAGEGDLVSMLRSLGTGVLRFGGVTADEQIAWREGGAPRPSWALGSLEAGNLARARQRGGAERLARPADAGVRPLRTGSGGGARRRRRRRRWARRWKRSRSATSRTPTAGTTCARNRGRRCSTSRR